MAAGTVGATRPAATAPIKPSSESTASCNRQTSDTTDKGTQRVQTGLVAWHTSFSEACKKSKLSGKPVLLFEMLGKLDDEFC